jgi:Rieske Fe-S protein
MTRRHRDLDHMVEALLAGESLPPGRLDPEEIAALRAAIELRAARPGEDQPDGAFVTSLRRRLAAAATPETDGAPGRMPRRAVIAGAAAAIAGGVVGAVAEGARKSPTTRAAATGEILPDDGQWVPVATPAEVAGGRTKRFATASAVGFLTERAGQLSAVSGACTHQGCMLRLNESAGRLDCPCHRTAFGVDGAVMFSELAAQPAELPRIRVRTRAGQIEAFLPRDA